MLRNGQRSCWEILHLSFVVPPWLNCSARDESDAGTMTVELQIARNHTVYSGKTRKRTEIGVTKN